MTLVHCFDFLSNAISAVVYYHNAENRPVNGICVANHTSPIDALVLMCDNCYSLVSLYGFSTTDDDRCTFAGSSNFFIFV